MSELTALPNRGSLVAMRMQGKFVRCLSVASVVAALSLAASASSSWAAVTLGQTGSPATTCADNIDRLQPTVTSGNGYVVPSTGGISNWTVTSWSTQALSGAGQTLAMKVYRPLGGSTYMVVGRNGPHPLAVSTLNTFPASVAVKAGDVLGLSTTPDAGLPGCRFGADGHLSHTGNLADGESGEFDAGGLNGRLNVSAVIAPTNSFKLGDVDRNRRKGTATLTVEDVPNPGELTGSGNGVKASSAGRAVTSKSVGAGQAQLLIKAKGKKKKKLNQKGKVKLNVAITYTPTGGDPSTQSVKVKLKKKL